MTVMQMIAAAVAVGVVGGSLGWIAERGLQRLRGPSWWIATGSVLVVLGAISCLWLYEDLQRAGVL